MASLEPAATILNYGQGIFEGMKAFRTEKGRSKVDVPAESNDYLKIIEMDHLLPKKRFSWLCI